MEKLAEKLVGVRCWDEGEVYVCAEMAEVVSLRANGVKSKQVGSKEEVGYAVSPFHWALIRMKRITWKLTVL